MEKGPGWRGEKMCGLTREVRYSDRSFTYLVSMYVS